MFFVWIRSCFHMSLTVNGLFPVAAKRLPARRFSNTASTQTDGSGSNPEPLGPAVKDWSTATDLKRLLF